MARPVLVAPRMRYTSLLALLVAACSQQAPADDQDDCARLRDHTIELSLAAASDLPEDVRAAHREQLRAAAGAAHADRCASLRDDEVACSLAADSLDALAACTGGAR